MFKAYYLLRDDLNMTPAKQMIQVAHGTDLIWSLYMENGGSVFGEWIKDNRRKIVLKVSSLEKLQNIKTSLHTAILGLDIYDEGYTEFDGRTLTGMVIYPMDESRLPSNIKRLRLWS